MPTEPPTWTAIEQLPLEVLLAISQHLPRPRPLIHLASASPTLYAHLAPIVHSSVTLANHAQLDAFVEQAPEVVKQRTRRLTLDKSLPPWSYIDLAQALDAVEELDGLRLTSLALSPSEAVALLAQSRKAVASLDSLVLDFAPASPGSSLDARTLLPWTNDEARGNTLPSAPPALARTPSLSHAPQPSKGPDPTAAAPAHVLVLLRACLATCPNLRSLRLANLPLPASALCGTFEGSASSSICVGGTRLRELELEEVHLGDGELREVLRMAEGSLELLKVVKCTGYSSAGLVEALQMHGLRLRKLEVVVAEPKSSTRRPTPPPSPARSPPRSPTRSPTLSAAQHLSTHTHSLDAALPYLPHLTHLSLSGSTLVSPSALASLPTTTPHLRSLSLSQHALSTPAHLLPLVRDGTARLPHLRHLALHPPSTPADSDCLSPCVDDHDDPAIADLWTACLASDIDLVGAPFSRVKERLEWATTEAARVACTDSQGGKGERRKRPSLAV